MPTLSDIARVIHGEVGGDGTLEITHACEISPGTPGGITFLADPRYRPYLSSTLASAVILDPSTDPAGKPTIRVENPARAFAEVLAFLHPESIPPSGIHATAIIGEEVRLGSEVSIGPYAVIGDRVSLGDGTIIAAGVHVGSEVSTGARCRLYPRVVLYDRVVLGKSVIIHSGSVIGADGFGFTTEKGVHHKIPQVGRVVIGDDVEIGANCTIDRGTIGDTIIGEGCKLDNLIMVAHNVKIGRGCLFAGMVGIAGSTVIGDYVTLAGQVGVVDHVTVGDRVVVASKSAVMQSLPGGKFYAGIPCVERQQWLRQSTATKKLPELLTRMRRVEEQLSGAAGEN